jgi:hypothetical protein
VARHELHSHSSRGGRQLTASRLSHSGQGKRSGTISSVGSANVDDLVQQMRLALAAGAYMPSLMVALTIPDICGAVSSDNGRSSGAKYKSWLTEWVRLVEHPAIDTSLGPDEAELIYGFRCSLLHQGSAHPHGGGPPIAFIEPAPGASQLHNLSTVVGDSTIFWLSVPAFVEAIAAGVDRWWAAVGTTATVSRNMERYARRRPEGLPPHAGGAPVIA